MAPRFEVRIVGKGERKGVTQICRFGTSNATASKKTYGMGR